MDSDTILGMLDEQSRTKAFEHCFSTLKTASHIDLDALSVCIKLWPRLEPSHGDDHKLFDLLISRIPHEPLDLDHVYHLVEVLCQDRSFADILFRDRIHADLLALRLELAKPVDGDAEAVAQQNMRKATAYFTLLRCSYWLPSDRNHVIGPGLLELLSSFLGLPDLDEVVLDTISALLSLLKRGEPITVAQRDLAQPGLKPSAVPGQIILAGPIADGTLWDQLSTLEPTYFTTGRFAIFISPAV